MNPAVVLGLALLGKVNGQPHQFPVSLAADHSLRPLIG
jgi:hypothetical protein